MTETEKQAKLKALKSINSSAKKAMSGKLSKKKPGKENSELKKHVESMSKDTDIDFLNDSNSITDPMMDGRVVGRKISEKNEECAADSDMSVYDIDAKLEKLMKKKKDLSGRSY